jgi:transposase
MSRYVGLDVHKQFIEVCILEVAGQVVWRGRTGCLRDELESFARKRLQKTDRVALEATTNTWSVVAVLQPHVAAVVVSNPLKTKAIAEAKVKTDKVDALVLAQLLRCDYLPSVWHPDEQTQRWRGLVTHRTALTTHRARIKNHVQSLLGRLLLRPPCKCLWTKTGLAWLKEVSLPAPERLVLDSELRQRDAVQGEVEQIDAELVGIAQQEPRVRLLMTLPGVNYVVALGLLAGLGDVSRFQDGDQAAAYLGLVPSTRQSGRCCYQGPITKAGRSQTRWLLTQSAQQVARHPGPLGGFFRRLAKRKNRNVAITAVARKLVTVAFLMLKNNEPYRYARPELMQEKFAKVPATSATTKKGKGTRSRAKEKPNLAEVYRAAGLPEVQGPEQLPAGEQRMLTAYQLDDFVAELYPPRGAKATVEGNEGCQSSSRLGCSARHPQR